MIIINPHENIKSRRKIHNYVVLYYYHQQLGGTQKCNLRQKDFLYENYHRTIGKMCSG